MSEPPCATATNPRPNSSLRGFRQTLNGLLIPLCILLPIGLAYIMFVIDIGMPTSTTNHGQLIQPPIALSELKHTITSDSQSNPQATDHPKWRILIPIDAQCKSVCDTFLYLSRQVHIRLGEKAYRVQRILLLLDPLPQKHIATLKDEHPGTVFANSTRDEFNAWLSQTEASTRNSAVNQFYLIDQAGYAMMAYDQNNTGEDLLDDLKKLLKFSYD